MSFLDRTKSRADVGRDLVCGWDALELVLIRAGEVAAGQEFHMPGMLNVAMAHGERGGYFTTAEVRKLLGVRCDYLAGRRPSTATMRKAADDIHRLERQVRERLGPLAPDPLPEPPRPKPL
jgi:hypothetical protein